MLEDVRGRLSDVTLMTLFSEDDLERFSAESVLPIERVRKDRNCVSTEEN
jgi:hypothetical protein